MAALVSATAGEEPTADAHHHMAHDDELGRRYAEFLALIEAAQAGQSRAGEVARVDLPTVPRKALP
jgi:hypothetical protein